MFKLLDSIYASVIVIMFGLILFILNKFGVINYEVLFSNQILYFLIYAVFVYLINAELIVNKHRMPIISREVLSIFYVLELAVSMFLVLITQNQILSFISLGVSILTFTAIATYRYWGKEKDYVLVEDKSISGIAKIWKLSMSYRTLVVVTIFALFLAVRFYIVNKYSGSYLDEYLHIFTGRFFFDDTYHQIYTSMLPYDRGMYVSLFSALLSRLFGNHIEIQKLIPIIIGSLNFFLLYNLSKKLLKTSWLRFVLLITYSFAPLVVFNDTYIRTYVFYELFAYIAIFLSLKIVESYELKKWKAFIVNIVFTAVYLLMLVLSQEVEVLLFAVFMGIMIGLYLVINSNEILHFPFVEKFKIKKLYFIFAVIILFVVLLRFININKYIDTFLYGQLVHGGGSAEKYTTLFFIELIFITSLFINTGFSLLLSQFDKTKKVIILSIFLLFIIHQVITPDFRNLRGIFYFMPLFFLGALSIYEVLGIKNMFLNILFSILFIITPVLSAPKYINIGPTIPREIDYFPFKEFYSVVKKECAGSVIISAMHSNFISNYYDVKPNYILYLRMDFLNEDVRYYNTDNNYFQSEDDVPVLTNLEVSQNIIKNNKVCVLLTTEFRHTGQYLSGNEYDTLFVGMNETQVQSLKLLKNF
jgi:hypothetical protein